MSRNPVRKWLRAEEGREPQYRRQAGSTKLTPYADRLRQMLVADGHRPKRDRRTALMLFAELKKLGYGGSYNRG